MITRASAGTAPSLSYGSDLTQPSQDASNKHQGDWGELEWTHAWVEYSNYQNSFYFPPTADDTVFSSASRRTNFGNTFTQGRPSQDTSVLNCRYFIRSGAGNPFSGGTVKSTCGAMSDAGGYGPAYDVNGGWCWWGYSSHSGSGKCDGGSAGTKARAWVR